jgi:hypothetical protein
MKYDYNVNIGLDETEREKLKMVKNELEKNYGSQSIASTFRLLLSLKYQEYDIQRPKN